MPPHTLVKYLKEQKQYLNLLLLEKLLLDVLPPSNPKIMSRVNQPTLASCCFENITALLGTVISKESLQIQNLNGLNLSLFNFHWYQKTFR